MTAHKIWFYMNSLPATCIVLANQSCIAGDVVVVRFQPSRKNIGSTNEACKISNSNLEQNHIIIIVIYYLFWKTGTPIKLNKLNKDANYQHNTDSKWQKEKI
jgi:hypothetical protein